MIIKWFLCLMFYSFLGWVYESVLCSVRDKGLTNRGFLTGPIIPVYGFGGMLSVVLFHQRTGNVVTLFLSGVFLTGAVEYVTGYLLEKIFNMKWWDYSDHRYNLQGRVCLQSVTVFGAMAAIIVKYVHPLVLEVMDRIPENMLTALAACILIALAVDIYSTLNHLVHLDKKLEEIQEALDKFVESRKEHAASIEKALLDKFETSEYYSEKIRNFLTTRQFHDKRISMAFPRLMHHKYNEAWERIKARVSQKEDTEE